VLWLSGLFQFCGKLMRFVLLCSVKVMVSL
jgi:hypothetical protein